MQAFLTLDFGNAKDQISSAAIFKSSDSDLHGDNTVANVLHHTTFMLEVLKLVFLPEVVTRIATMIQDVREKMRPQSGLQFTTLIDAMIQAISKPQIPDRVSIGAFLRFCDVAFDTSSNNQNVVNYKEDMVRQSAAAQDAAIASQAADVADLKIQLAASKRSALSMSSGSNFAKSGGQPSTKKAKTGTDKKPSRMQNTTTLVELIQKHMKKAPVDGYASKNHTDKKPLCVSIAKGKLCVAHGKGGCNQYVHERLPEMTDAYVAWAAKRPVYNDILKKV